MEAVAARLKRSTPRHCQRVKIQVEGAHMVVDCEVTVKLGLDLECRTMTVRGSSGIVGKKAGFSR
jgi:hypothetical protein